MRYSRSMRTKNAPAVAIAATRRMLRNGEAAAVFTRNHLSHAEVGAAVGKSGTEVGRYLKGQARPRSETALALADLLGELGTLEAQQ